MGFWESSVSNMTLIVFLFLFWDALSLQPFTKHTVKIISFPFACVLAKLISVSIIRAELSHLNFDFNTSIWLFALVNQQTDTFPSYLVNIVACIFWWKIPSSSVIILFVLNMHFKCSTMIIQTSVQFRSFYYFFFYDNNNNNNMVRINKSKSYTRIVY